MTKEIEIKVGDRFSYLFLDEVQINEILSIVNNNWIVFKWNHLKVPFIASKSTIQKFIREGSWKPYVESKVFKKKTRFLEKRFLEQRSLPTIIVPHDHEWTLDWEDGFFELEFTYTEGQGLDVKVVRTPNTNDDDEGAV